MISPAVFSQSLRKLAALKYLTAMPETLSVLGDILSEYCRSDDEMKAVVSRILEDLDEWPGPKTFRGIVAGTWRELFGPKESSDGVNPYMEWRPEWGGSTGNS